MNKEDHDRLDYVLAHALIGIGVGLLIAAIAALIGGR